MPYLERNEIAVIFIGALLLTALFAFQACGQQTWIKTYGGAEYDEGYAVQQTADGGYIIAGMTNSFGAGGGDVYLIKTNGSGDALWTRTSGGGATDIGYSVQQTSDGGFIVAGYTASFGEGSTDVYLLKTNDSGDTLWTRTCGGANGDCGNSVQQTSDGGFIVAGYIGAQPPLGRLRKPGVPSPPHEGGDVYVIKTDANGGMFWSRVYGGTGDDGGCSVKQTADGGYIIAGYTGSYGVGGGDVYLIKRNAVGYILWSRTYGGTSNDAGNSVHQTADGGYVIAGTTSSFGAGGNDVYLIKTDSLGDTLWTRTYGGPADDEGWSIQQTSEGGYVIAGSTNSFGAGNYDVYLIKTNASGDTLWTRTFGGAENDAGSSVQPTSDGGYIVTGTTLSFGAGSEDVYLIKTDGNGRVGVEERPVDRRQEAVGSIKATPNPFHSYATVPGHEGERFEVYDVMGRKAGTYPGGRIGEGLPAGVYFLRSANEGTKPVRIVKVR